LLSTSPNQKRITIRWVFGSDNGMKKDRNMEEEASVGDPEQRRKGFRA